MDSNSLSADQMQKEQLAPVFFPVSLLKLAILSFFSLGLYEIWWSYKNWSFVKDSLGQNIRPGWRALFAVFFIYQLFKEIRQFGQKHGVTESLAAGWLATAWIFIGLSWRISHMCLYLSLFSFLPLLPVQRHINRINLAIDPKCEINSKFTAGNWIMLAIGLILLILDIVSEFSPNT